MAQPRAPTIIAIDGGADEERTTNENTSVESMNEERPTKMADKRMAGEKAEVAKPRTSEVSEPSTPEVSETSTAETMTATKTHLRCCSRVPYIDRRESCRACPAFRGRQSGERKGRQYKLMLEHWTSPCVATTPVR
jgi:hypothetical protein